MTHKGSCHCGKVRYTADIDLSKGAFRCNCSICAKGRTWLAQAEPNSVHIEGEESLTTYSFGPKRIQHRFCAVCGIKTFGQVAGMGTVVNIATLDDMTPEALADLPIHYLDGHADRFDRPPAITSYL